MAFKSSFLQEAKARGFIYQATDIETLDALMAKQVITAYIGFDPTAASLHVGNMTSIMLLRLLQKHGHKPIVLVGGATAKIGDPTGKDAMRSALSDETITNNIESIKKCFTPYIKFGNEDSDAILVNNNDWMSAISYLDFLRTYGTHFSVNRMLTFDSVKSRLDRDQSLSFLEFNYMIFQAYDFVELYKKNECVLQCGGSDQWGNIVSGVDLGRRMLDKTLFGLTTPLVTTSNGAKMGKTANGAVWLLSEYLSPFDYWQFWRNTEDKDVGRYLKLFTDIPVLEIEELEKEKGASINDVKKILADHATTLAHGQESLESIHKTVSSLFESKSNNDLSILPTFEITKLELKTLSIDTLFLRANLCQTKGEVKRLVEGGGAKIQDTQVDNSKALIDEVFHNEPFLKFSFGKKKHHILKVID